MRLLRMVMVSGLLAASLWLVSCANQEQAPSAAKLKDETTRNEAADFELEDANGQKLKLSELRGKVILLNFWATWCTPCKVEIPWFIEMEREFKDDGFAVVGVSMDEDGWKAVKPYMSDMKVNYRMVLGTEEMAQLYGGVEALPTSFIIDRNGKVASVHMGIVSRNVFEEEIRALLAVKAAKTGRTPDGRSARRGSAQPLGWVATRPD